MKKNIVLIIVWAIYLGLLIWIITIDPVEYGIVVGAVLFRVILGCLALLISVLIILIWYRDSDF